MRRQLALALAHHLPHVVVARDDRHHPVDPRPPDRRRHVRARDEHAAVFVERDRASPCEPAQWLALGQRQPLAHREPGQRAVHRAGIEVAEAEPLRQKAGDRALARACGPVDGDDHLCASWSMRS